MTVKAKTKPAQLEAAEMQQARTFVGDAWNQFRKHQAGYDRDWRASRDNPRRAHRPANLDAGSRSTSISPPLIQVASPEHPWGTDSLGRDTLARALQGGRVSLMIGISAMLVSITIGTVIGLASGYFQPFGQPADAHDRYLHRPAAAAPAAGA